MEDEDITGMVIDSRDVEDDDLTTAYLKGYADAEEKYRKKIKELETKQKAMCEEYCPKVTRIKELEEENKKKSIENICYQEELENSIPVQKVKDKIEEYKKQKDKYESETQEVFANNYYHRKILELTHKILGLEKLLEDK